MYTNKIHRRCTILSIRNTAYEISNSFFRQLVPVRNIRFLCNRRARDLHPVPYGEDINVFLTCNGNKTGSIGIMMISYSFFIMRLLHIILPGREHANRSKIRRTLVSEVFRMPEKTVLIYRQSLLPSARLDDGIHFISAIRGSITQIFSQP